jgi:hypothetical protein
MRYIDYGLGAFHRIVFADLPMDMNIDLSTVLQRLLQDGNLAAFEVRERFFEIGSAAGLRDTEEFLKIRQQSEMGAK